MTDRTSDPSPDEAPKLKEYDGEGITVTFEPRRCLHAAACVHGLPDVFDLQKRPWVQPDQASAERVAEVIRRCPSGALRYRLADGAAEAPDSPTTVQRLSDGRLLVRGDLLVRTGPGGTAAGERHEVRAVLCGCGDSANQPYCDHSGPCANGDFDIAAER
ncbi:(4Fe-4S)-binding protein [Streptomyces sp. NPDC090025]|uniref:(4Fe-4S)-binding protein n=1 Tax=Streptomyces sp. NPDC090025 TaxID=3365922 RepID=UPI003833B612